MSRPPVTQARRPNIELSKARQRTCLVLESHRLKSWSSKKRAARGASACVCASTSFQRRPQAPAPVARHEIDWCCMGRKKNQQEQNNKRTLVGQARKLLVFLIGGGKPCDAAAGKNIRTICVSCACTSRHRRRRLLGRESMRRGGAGQCCHIWSEASHAGSTASSSHERVLEKSQQPTKRQPQLTHPPT